MKDDWSSHSFRQALVTMVRRRVPDRDAEDVVQAVLAEAVSSTHRPGDPEATRRWIWGVARNKVADYHRRARREVFDPPEEVSAPSDAATDDLLRWAVGEIPSGSDAHRTFEWLLREGDGEKLEEIAQAERVPAAVVRQRVSRMRRFLRARWGVVAAGIAVLGCLAYFVVRRGVRGPDGFPIPMVTPEDTALRARMLRDDARRSCAAQQWRSCLDALDGARRLDARGDEVPEISVMRTRAVEALARPDAGPVTRPLDPIPLRNPTVTVGEGPTSSTSVSVDSPSAIRRRRRISHPSSGSSLPPPGSTVSSP